jgi:hypothetical protein
VWGLIYADESVWERKEEREKDVRGTKGRETREREGQRTGYV